MQQYFAGETDPAKDNGDGPDSGTFRASLLTGYSIDGGLNWTATVQQYTDGEHDPAKDNGDGPGAGMFQARSPRVELYSFDGGSTWGRSLDGWHVYILGEVDPAKDNGDGPDSGTFRSRSTAPEYSIDGGSTWTATLQQYTDGEADPAKDNGDGPDSGTFRSQEALLVNYRCIYYSGTFYALGVGDYGTWSVYTTLNNPIIRPCPDRSSQAAAPYTWNVDHDGPEPTGDWCVSGVSSMICRADGGYTYREAREELGYNLGRP